mmetsp:Transcript_743/g.775  ORF Transcript_743/g.775 Transcript_743/m.775 type:complete len:90 (-) Transcript_743:847-1116(-)
MAASDVFLSHSYAHHNQVAQSFVHFNPLKLPGLTRLTFLMQPISSISLRLRLSQAGASFSFSLKSIKIRCLIKGALSIGVDTSTASRFG